MTKSNIFDSNFICLIYKKLYHEVTTMTQTQKQKLFKLLNIVAHIANNDDNDNNKDLVNSAIDFQESLNQDWNIDEFVDEIRKNVEFIEI